MIQSYLSVVSFPSVLLWYYTECNLVWNHQRDLKSKVWFQAKIARHEIRLHFITPILKSENSFA